MARVASELMPTPLRGVPALPTVRWRLVLWLSALTVLAGLAAASYLAYVGSRATTSYSIQRLQGERDAWRVRNDQLRLELAKVRSLTWVEHEAVTRLNMQKPAQLVYLKVEAAGPAAAAPTAAAPGQR